MGWSFGARGGALNTFNALGTAAVTSGRWVVNFEVWSFCQGTCESSEPTGTPAGDAGAVPAERQAISLPAVAPWRLTTPQPPTPPIFCGCTKKQQYTQDTGTRNGPTWRCQDDAPAVHRNVMAVAVCFIHVSGAPSTTVTTQQLAITANVPSKNYFT